MIHTYNPMLLSKFGHESLPQKKKSSSGLYLFLVFLVLLIAGGYWFYRNYQRLFFNFKKDKYAIIIQTLNDLESSDLSNQENDQRNRQSTEELLEGLLKDNPSDSYLYYLSGKLYFIEIRRQLMDKPGNLTELLFLDIIHKFRFPDYLSHQDWERGIGHLRKAILLELQEKDNESAISYLSGLYLAGGSGYWQSARPLLAKGTGNEVIQNLYRIVFADAEPDWELLSKTYDKETIVIWTALYNMKIKNNPLAFFYLKQLLLSDNVPLRNIAYYLMGFLMDEQKNLPLKLYYHSLIDCDDFLKKHPWFLEEHNYTLRFMGQDAAASKFLSQYEKMVLQEKEKE